ncbi:MAG TPA: L,D-transpeptidase, partial [Clostridiales bacterium]|nr:L,D-transpeptidase [Clostridiales bacterium]
FFSERYEQGARWWVSFRDWGIYLFHSVPVDRTGEVIPEEADKLGQPASHGCVRLSMEDARWFYETIPEGTPVDID